MNDEVTLTAVADTYWEFGNWSGDLTGSDNPATMVIDSDKNVIAVFTLTDTDNDGITDQEEASGPSGGGVLGGCFISAANNSSDF